MSVTSSQILGASTAVGGIAFLPYTGGNPLFEIFQYAFKISFLLLIVVVILQVLVRILQKPQQKTTKSHTKKSSFLSRRAYVQIALLYIMVLTALSLHWLESYSISQQKAQAKEINATSSVTSENDANTPKMGTPTHLTIESIKVSLEVGNGEYKNGTWNLSNDKVLYVTNTVKPNNIAKNTVLYGHNTSAVLLPTKDLKVGDELILDTVEGYQFTYRYVSDRLVKPDDISVFNDTSAPQLTLITCSGIFNSHRRLMNFEFVSAEKSQ